MINLTVVIDNEEAVRKFRELQQTAKTVTSNVVNDADRMDIAMRKLGSTLAQIGVGVSLAGFVRQLAMTRGEFQQLEVAFTTLLQSKEKADALMAEMVELAAKTPFDLQGVADGARQLLAYGFAAEDITDTLTRLGNVAAGLGLPLERLTYLYGTTMVQGRLYARDMLQFTSSGIPVLQEMAKMYGVTTEEINAMVTAGKIGFEDVKKVIEGMTNEGGQFYNLMQERSKTISGLISNLSDAIDNMFNSIGKSSEGIIAGALKGAISLVENYQKVLDVLIPLISAYGAYKAALIATAAIQKVQATVAATKAILEQTKMLTRATQAQILFNQAVKANPYVLAAGALAGLISLIVRLTKTTEEASDETEGLAAVNQKVTEQMDAEIAKLQSLQGILNDSNASYSARKKALDDIKSIVPSYHADLTEEGTLINNNTDALRTYMTELERSIRLKSAQDELEEAYKKQREQQRTYDAASQKLFSMRTNTAYDQKAIIDIASLLGITDIQQAEKAVENARKELDKTNKTILQLQKEIAEGLAVTTTPPGDGTIVSAADNLKAAQKAYNDAVKAWKEAVKGGADIGVVKELQGNVDTAKKALDEAKKLAGVDDKTTNAVTEAQKKLTALILANDQALQQSRINAMREGKQKELAEIDLRTQQELQKIDEDAEELRNAQNGKLTDTQTAQFEERRANIQRQSTDDRAAVELKYAQELDKIYKQITEETLSEEERRIKGIKDKYDEFRKWVKDALAAGNITEEQAKDLGIKIDNAETAASLNAVIKTYGSAEDKITEIHEKAESARLAATRAGRTDLISEINKSEEQQIGAVRAEELMQTDDWINLFQNLEALSSREILRIIDNINNLLKDADLAPINLKTVTDQLEKAADTASRKNPFVSIVANFKAYKSAVASGNDIEAIEARQKAWEGVSEAMQIVSASISGISSIASALGADEDTTSTINDIAGAVGGAAQAAAGFASGNIVQGIQGVVSAVTSIISLANGDKAIERTIEGIQDRIDDLSDSYEKLDKAADKVYSTRRASIIEQQNDVLQQQKQLIEQQIREEQSKKNPDDDRIAEYRDAIDDIDQQMSNNVDSWQEAINGISFDSFRNDFLDTLMDMDASAEDFANSFEEYLQRSILDALIAEKYDDRIKKLYDKMAEYGEDGLTQEEIDELRKEREDIVNDALADRDKLAQIYGWDEMGDEGSRTAEAKGIAQASQDSIDELNGSQTAIKGLLASIDVNVGNIVQQGMTIAEKFEMIVANGQGMQEQVSVANLHLAAIQENTRYCRHLESMEKNIAYLYQSVDRMVREGISVK